MKFTSESLLFFTNHTHARTHARTHACTCMLTKETFWNDAARNKKHEKWVFFALCGCGWVE